MGRWPGWTIAVPLVMGLSLGAYALMRPPGPVLAIDASTTGVEQSRPVPGQQWKLDDGITLDARTAFSLTGRVLSTKRYRNDGMESKISPLDLALGWGPMSDPSMATKLNVSQSGRWYHYRWEGAPPLEPSVIGKHSSNMHIIPATPLAEKVLLSLDAGDVVSLSGHLVDAQAPNGWRWKTSLSREDTGQGACEIFRVEHVLLHE